MLALGQTETSYVSGADGLNKDAVEANIVRVVFFIEGRTELSHSLTFVHVHKDAASFKFLVF